MYFDDRERFLDIEEMWNKFSFDNSLSHVKNNQWISSLSEEKHLALERFLGYDLKSASNLSDEKIEEETLRWAVDTNFVSDECDDDEQLTPEKLDHSDKSKNYNSGRQQRLKSSKYDIIKDLQVSSSNSTLQSLSFLWDGIADAIEQKLISESSSSTTSTRVWMPSLRARSQITGRQETSKMEPKKPTSNLSRR